LICVYLFFFQAEDGIRDRNVTGVQTCALPIFDPDEDALVETALECAKTAATFGIDPKIAFLSYSTKGSGKGEAVDKVKNACEKRSEERRVGNECRGRKERGSAEKQKQMARVKE